MAVAGGGDSSPLPPSRGALPLRTYAIHSTQGRGPQGSPRPAHAGDLAGSTGIKAPRHEAGHAVGGPHERGGYTSQGPGRVAGLATMTAAGVGTGKGPGYGPGSDGGCCEGAFQVGGIDGVSAPIAIYSPEPAYSEEARKLNRGNRVRCGLSWTQQGNVRNVPKSSSIWAWASMRRRSKP